MIGGRVYQFEETQAITVKSLYLFRLGGSPESMSRGGSKILMVGIHAKTKHGYQLGLAASSAERLNARGGDVRPTRLSGRTSGKRELEIVI